MGTDDLLVALAEPNGTSSSQALERLGVRAPDIRRKLKRGGLRSSPSHIPLGEDTKRAIDAAMREADNRGEVYVDSGHFLLGLVAEHHGAGGRIVSELGLSYSAVQSALESLSRPELAVPHSEVMSRLREAAAQEHGGPGDETAGTANPLDSEADPPPDAPRPS